jgi:ribosomal-protein-alanine N-acetyltransferase
MRPLETKDLAWLIPMDRACFHTAWSEAAWREELEGRLAHYYAMEAGGVPLGYGGFWLIAGEAQIMRLAIAPQYRGKGLGLRLVALLLAEAKKLEGQEVSLEVRAGNLPARRTYERLGLTVCGQRPHYYSDNGEDAILMHRTLV